MGNLDLKTQTTQTQDFSWFLVIARLLITRSVPFPGRFPRLSYVTQRIQRIPSTLMISGFHWLIDISSKQISCAVLLFQMVAYWHAKTLGQEWTPKLLVTKDGYNWLVSSRFPKKWGCLTVRIWSPPGVHHVLRSCCYLFFCRKISATQKFIPKWSKFPVSTVPLYTLPACLLDQLSS